MTPQLVKDPHNDEYVLQLPASPCEKIARGYLCLSLLICKGASAIAGIVMKFSIDNRGLIMLDQPSDAPRKLENASIHCF